MGRGREMLRVARDILDIILLVACLFMTAVLYYGGNLGFIAGILTILLVAAVRVYTWQIRRLIRRSERDFDQTYQQYLDAMGYGNGKKK